MRVSSLAKISLLTLVSSVSLSTFAANTMQVPPSSENQTAVDRTLTAEEDSKITNTIESQIKESQLLSSSKVDVTTKDGVVTLKGNLESDSQASNAIEIAQSVIGVRDVEAGDLKVKDGKQPFADMMITSRIKGLLIREKLFGEKDVAAINTSVETKDGVVYLTGHVESDQQIQNAIDIIKKNIKGVNRVEYKVKKLDHNQNAASNTEDTTAKTAATTNEDMTADKTAPGQTE